MENPLIVQKIENLLGIELHQAPIHPDKLTGVMVVKEGQAKYAMEGEDLIGLNLAGVGLTDDQWKDIVKKIKSDDKVLLVDDVFDSGRSVEAILNNLITETGRNMPTDIRVACPWFKPMRNKTEHKPDYYVHQTDDWLVFPHELSGLSLDEITKGKPELAKYITQHLS